MHNDILRSIDNGGGVILVLLDMSAAFDTVNHKLLLSRMVFVDRSFIGLPLIQVDQSHSVRGY